MSTIQNTDYFQVDSGGTQYKISASDLRTGTKSYDYLAVNRSSTDYRLAKSSRYDVNYTDYLAVNRSGTDYKVSGEDYFNYMWQYSQIASISASDGVSGDRFSYSASAGNDKIIFGAPEQSSNSGAAYIYASDGSNQIKIVASDGVAGDSFGRSVSVGENKVVVGAYAADRAGTSNPAGAAYIYNLDGSGQIKIVSSDLADNDNFGINVAIGDGIIAVGAEADDNAVGTNAGAIYIFNTSGTQLTKINGPTAGQIFGRGVSVGEGKILGILVRRALLYNTDGSFDREITPPDTKSIFFGSYNAGANAIGEGRIVIGDPRVSLGGVSFTGQVFIFDLSGTVLARIDLRDISGETPAGADFFGESVSVNNGRIIVGALAAVYIFDLNCNFLSKIVLPNPASPTISTAISGGRIYIGNPSTSSNTGSAYIFN